MTDEPLAKKELSALDRAKAVPIAGVDMYVVEHKHQITMEPMFQEQFMVIRARNGRRYIFKENVEPPKKSRIIT